MRYMPRPAGSSSAEPTRSAIRSGLILAVVAAAIFATVPAIAAPAGAESPTEVAVELAIDGIFVAPGREDFDEEQMGTAIRQAQARGLRLVVAAPIDPQPTAAAFARRLQEASDADAAIVFPTEGGLEAHVIDELEAAQFRALAAARSKSTPEAAVEAFSAELLVTPTRALPPIIDRIIRWVVILALVLAGALALEQLLRRGLSRRAAASAERVRFRRPSP